MQQQSNERPDRQSFGATVPPKDFEVQSAILLDARLRLRKAYVAASDVAMLDPKTRARRSEGAWANIYYRFAIQLKTYNLKLITQNLCCRSLFR